MDHVLPVPATAVQPGHEPIGHALLQQHAHVEVSITVAIVIACQLFIPLVDRAPGVAACSAGLVVRGIIPVTSRLLGRELEPRRPAFRADGHRRRFVELQSTDFVLQAHRQRIIAVLVDPGRALQQVFLPAAQIPGLVVAIAVRPLAHLVSLGAVGVVEVQVEVVVAAVAAGQLVHAALLRGERRPEPNLLILVVLALVLQRSLERSVLVERGKVLGDRIGFYGDRIGRARAQIGDRNLLVAAGQPAGAAVLPTDGIDIGMTRAAIDHRAVFVDADRLLDAVGIDRLQLHARQVVIVHAVAPLVRRPGRRRRHRQLRDRGDLLYGNIVIAAILIGIVIPKGHAKRIILIQLQQAYPVVVHALGIVRHIGGSTPGAAIRPPEAVIQRVLAEQLHQVIAVLVRQIVEAHLLGRRQRAAVHLPIGQVNKGIPSYAGRPTSGAAAVEPVGLAGL